ncbi:hypothetical protein P7C73_g4253, partial [Tremellales sp. Uapishka_1]
MASPRNLYRSFLQHLRHLPDPHVWFTLQPRFRDLVSAPKSLPSDERLFQLRAERKLKRARKEYNKLRAAVSSHTHALERLLDEAYGQRGAVRWELINSVIATSPPTGHRALPGPLEPLRPLPLPPPTPNPRARTRIPASTTRRLEKRRIDREWKEVKVPLVFSCGPAKTGWEGKSVVENLRTLAGLEHGEREVSTIHLEPHIRKLFPKRTYTLLPQYPTPPPRATRTNPTMWSDPKSLTPRLLRRAYKRLWDRLAWVYWKDGRWRKCGWEELGDVGGRWSQASEEEQQWITP